MDMCKKTVIFIILLWGPCLLNCYLKKKASGQIYWHPDRNLWPVHGMVSMIWDGLCIAKSEERVINKLGTALVGNKRKWWVATKKSCDMKSQRKWENAHFQNQLSKYVTFSWPI